MQNLADLVNSVPHFTHCKRSGFARTEATASTASAAGAIAADSGGLSACRVRGVPHALQNFAVFVNSVPHFTHCKRSGFALACTGATATAGGATTGAGGLSVRWTCGVPHDLQNLAVLANSAPHFTHCKRSGFALTGAVASTVSASGDVTADADEKSA